GRAKRSVPATQDAGTLRFARPTSFLSHAHERADPLGPLRLQNRVRSGRKAQHGRTSTEFKIRIELPGAAFHDDRGSLVLPTVQIEPRLVVSRLERLSGQIGLGVDR